MKEDFMETYVRKTLNEIKNCIKRNIKLEKEQEKKTDEKIYLVFKELIDGILKNINLDDYGNLIYTLIQLIDGKENDKIKCLLALYYTASYFDNVKLLNRMLQEKVNFGYTPSTLYYCVLDKDISSKFEEKEYIEIVKRRIHIFEGFYETTNDLPKEEREKYITRFVSIIKARHNDFSVHLGHWMLSKSRLDIYEDSSYLKASEKQLSIIEESNPGYIKNEDTIRRLNNLIQTTDFSRHYSNTDLIFSLFSDDELFNISYQIGEYFNTFSENPDMLNKAMDFYSRIKDENLDKIIIYCYVPTFMEVDNDTLVEIYNKIGLIPNDNDLKTMIALVKPKVKLKRIFKRK